MRVSSGGCAPMRMPRDPLAILYFVSLLLTPRCLRPTRVWPVSCCFYSFFCFHHFSPTSGLGMNMHIAGRGVGQHKRKPECKGLRMGVPRATGTEEKGGPQRPDEPMNQRSSNPKSAGCQQGPARALLHVSMQSTRTRTGRVRQHGGWDEDRQHKRRCFQDASRSAQQ